MKEKKFIEEYRNLCIKYKLMISGCGCCQSPFIIDFVIDEELIDNIVHLTEECERDLRSNENEQ